MPIRKICRFCLPVLLFSFVTATASAQSFRVQCPTSTVTHPTAANNNSEPTYNGATTFTTVNGYQSPTGNVNGAIKCQQISGGDGFATMGDGSQTYLFAFGPLSGLAHMAAGLPGTEFPSVFNTVYPSSVTPPQPGFPNCDPSSISYPTCLTSDPTYNGAVGLTGDQEVLVPGAGGGAAAVATVSGGLVIDVTVTAGGSGYTGQPSVTFSPPTNPACTPTTCITATGTAFVSGGLITSIDITYTGLGYTDTSPPTITIGPAANACAGPDASGGCLTGHVDPRPIMDVGVMNGNIPAPLMAIDEDDEFFLTLSNVGQLMRPDLFEQHTVHFHGYPNASAFYDGVPDASVAINIGGSFTYYYLAPDAGTYFWHCHITPPEHLQMGMVGQLYVRPRQNRVPTGHSLWASLAGGSGLTGADPTGQQSDLRTKCDSTDILCSNPVPAVNTGATGGGKYAYNDGDGSTRYDVEYPLQIHGFDPNFHFVGMTFNPEGFTDMKDKYFLLNGRSYPDTITPGPLATQATDGAKHFSQPLSSIINITAGQRALLRISDLDVSEYQTLASLGIPMQVIGYNAKLLRDQAGNNLYYNTNSITLAGGESLDVILDSCGSRDSNFGCVNPIPSGTYFLYTPNLDHLSNDAENFGGLMTEVVIN